MSLNAALAIQTFEWLETWFIIMFQKHYDITELPIEKRTFQRWEKWRRYILFGVIAATYVGGLAAIVNAILQ